MTPAGADAPRVLFVLNDPENALTHRRPLVDWFMTQGWAVHVAAPRTGRENLLTRQGLSFHPVDLVRKSIQPLRDVRAVLQLRRILRDVRPHLIQTATLKAIVAGGLANRLGPRLPAVHLVTGLGSYFTRKGVPTLSQQLALRSLRIATAGPSQRIVVQNRDDLAVLQAAGIGAERLRLVRGSGVDVQRFGAAPEDAPPRVVLAARMLRSKGVEVFVAAARFLRPRYPQVRFQLVGDVDPGNRDSIAPEDLRAWQTEGVVEWRGYVAQVESVLAGAAIVCLPTTYGEGIPKVLLEAAACGVPLVATDVPGCREAVLPGENGLLVSPGDLPDLAHAIDRLLGDAQLRQRMGASSRRLAEAEFRSDLVVAQMAGVYAELHAPLSIRTVE